jgi:hypothetical protein
LYSCRYHAISRAACRHLCSIECVQSLAIGGCTAPPHGHRGCHGCPWPTEDVPCLGAMDVPVHIATAAIGSGTSLPEKTSLNFFHLLQYAFLILSTTSLYHTILFCQSRVYVRKERSANPPIFWLKPFVGWPLLGNNLVACATHVGSGSYGLCTVGTQ